MNAVTSRPVLIVASDSEGHRKNYTAVLARWFAGTGNSVVIACGPAERGIPASQSPILAQLLVKSGVHVINLQKEIVQDPIRFRALLSKLETELTPTWTLLVNGDECVSALQGKWPRESNQCRRAANFIYFPYEYPLDLRPYPFFGKLYPWAYHLRERYRYRRYFNREVWSRLGLDFILATDENAVTSLSHPRVRYLPEIYRAWGADVDTEPPEIGQARLSYAEFLSRHSGKDVLLYYGGRFVRRGYDILLQLAAEHNDTVFASVGRDYPEEKFPEATGLWRQQLDLQDRFFELNLPFLPENALIDDLFRSARYVILPYRNWYGLSGSLYQAVSYGCPVLVPDIGAMSAIVHRYGIGLTYRHLNVKHLNCQLAKIRRNPGCFRDNALRFSMSVDEKAVFTALAAIFKAE